MGQDHGDVMCHNTPDHPFDVGFRRAPDQKGAIIHLEPRRTRDSDHLRFVGRQPCIVCGRVPVEAHHVRFAQPRAMGRKVLDSDTVPLCALHHRDLHASGREDAWWQERHLDPLAIADQLWAISQRRLKQLS